MVGTAAAFNTDNAKVNLSEKPHDLTALECLKQNRLLLLINPIDFENIFSVFYSTTECGGL